MRTNRNPVTKIAPLALAVLCAISGNAYAQFVLSAVKATQAPSLNALAADPA